jgi:regulator of sigma E protease
MSVLEAGMWALRMLEVIIALGLVIFVHELGHFTVAKLCGVKCEKFYLGFDVNGMKLWHRQWGETEYGIGIVPLGGYVKMLGQDDNPTRAAEERERAKAQPKASAASAPAGEATIGTASADTVRVQAAPPQEHSALVTHSGDLPGEPREGEPEAYDPRSYMAQSVPKRMAIISAGVIMNLIFAVIFASIAYRLGVSYTPCVVGGASGGDPAWVADLQPGDKIIQFDDERPSEYLRFDNDLNPAVLFAGAGNELDLTIRRGDKTHRVTVRPTAAHEATHDDHAIIGVSRAPSTKLAEKEPTMPNSPAAEAKPPLEGGDQLIAATVLGKKHPLSNGLELEALLAQHPDQPITFTVERKDAKAPEAKPQELDVRVAPNPMRDLGLVLEMGPIVAIQAHSIGEQAGFKIGDAIVALNGRRKLDPLRLPDDLRKLAGKEVAIVVARSQDGKEAEVTLHVTPREPDSYPAGALPNSPWTADEIGVAYNIATTVHAVDAAASADASQIQPGDQITAAQFAPATEEQTKRVKELKLEDPIVFDAKHANWPNFQYLLQLFSPGIPVKLTLLRDKQEQTATLKTIEAGGWFFCYRGFVLEFMTEVRRADAWGEAFTLGLRETKESVRQTITSVRKLASGGVSLTNLGGPGTIAVVAAVSASEGLPRLLIFLTFLSANLAVLNFLPIPILDGGHMMFLLYEGIRGKPASERAMVALTYLGLAFILTLMIFAVGLDVFRGFRWLTRLFS